MRIVACLKQVPEDARFDRASNTVVREERKQMLNPADSYALALALAIKDRLGAEVTALTMGKPFAAKMLPAAAALGADRLFCVSDPAFGGSDTFATASILSRAIRHIGGADLVLCGRRAIDGETGQVGPELAVMLDMPCLTNVARLESVSEARIECGRLLEDRWEIHSAGFPCLLTCCDGVEGIAYPRMGSIATMRRALEIPVTTLSLHDLSGDFEGNLDDGSGDAFVFGRQGSPTRVRKTAVHEEQPRAGVLLTSPESGAAAIAEAVRLVLEEQAP
ncbi:MAG: electron transfer flavoprotein subunit beta/FixA family protein [Deltaproteobacteria bacterium]|nr:electron transfer flavoprotein subunit beta/FixA family protein [Deltaproteobacteria bacterium]